MNAFEAATRKVFDAHHRLQDCDEHIFHRLTTLITEEYFGLPAGAFRDMSILDAGCGSNANASYAFLSHGAKRVTSLELGEEWLPCATARLVKFGDRSRLVGGSVLDLPFETGTFDLVHCAGVLHHTEDPRRGFAELARVTKPGGCLFLTIMATGSGALYQCINRLREVYAQNQEFRSIIDDMSIESVEAGLDWLFSVKNATEAELIPGEESFIRSLFDKDLLLTIKDRLQAPTYHSFDFTETQVQEWFLTEGFVEPRRISRYTKGFENLRRFFAPMYLQYEHPVARFWFGDGYVQMIARRSVGAPSPR
ncbi:MULTISPECIES: class I SAM-dependent methyltransferase [Sinorhizobium]|uniref:Class I SAM-dependent methyltransferase n=2 Tax=Sinorhizobium TaxID=28105 RepID=A0A859QII5_9HYPH|nr:class I SAM-dependent methyltransferase [Sinorhizobium mexicanum]MBP1884854.1 SAM-dependent methyltransferase [Sinorhizobium mexicanum]QLL64504.1 class I SAM-dependent methyltransferase [Sinorhizobium mexicanum]